MFVDYLLFADKLMDTATAIGLAKGILNFSMPSTSLTYKEILAIKAMVPTMDLTPYEKEIVISRMRYTELNYEMEANLRIMERY